MLKIPCLHPPFSHKGFWFCLLIHVLLPCLHYISILLVPDFLWITSLTSLDLIITRLSSPLFCFGLAYFSSFFPAAWFHQVYFQASSPTLTAGCGQESRVSLLGSEVCEGDLWFPYGKLCWRFTRISPFVQISGCSLLSSLFLFMLFNTYFFVKVWPEKGNCDFDISLP